MGEGNLYMGFVHWGKIVKQLLWKVGGGGGGWENI